LLLQGKLTSGNQVKRDLESEAATSLVEFQCNSMTVSLPPNKYIPSVNDQIL
jgi:hypothetical protein